MQPQNQGQVYTKAPVYTDDHFPPFLELFSEGHMGILPLTNTWDVLHLFWWWESFAHPK